jgi:hypothetical protein
MHITTLSFQILELMKMLGLNYTEEEIQGMISEIDVDGDGDLDFDGEPARLLLLAKCYYGLVDKDINALSLLKIQ